MAKSRWRWSESLPVPLKVSLAAVSLLIMLSFLTFSLMSEDYRSVDFISVLFNVAAVRGRDITSDSLPNTLRSSPWAPMAVAPSPHIVSIFGMDNASTPAMFSSPSSAIEKEVPGKNSSVVTNSSSSLNLSTTGSPSLIFSEANPSPSHAPRPSAPLLLNVSTTYSPSSESPGPLPAPAPEPALHLDEEEKFLSPLLTPWVGAGNQLMEYISAAVIARSINRTLCLPPFFSGPRKHSGFSVRVRGGMLWEDRYDLSSLSRFTRVASLDQCLEQCNYTMDANWLLKDSREPLVRGWKSYHRNNESWNLDWSSAKWQSKDDIQATLGNQNDRCVGIFGLFPGLRWRGAFLAVSAFMQPALAIYEATNVLQTYAIGKDTPYLAVHWRFEESRCPVHQIGLCFSRCNDGAVIDSGLHPLAKEWLQAAESQCDNDGHFRGVGIDKWDLISAIEERAKNQSLKTLYMATDGWIRGPKGVALVKEIVLLLRSRGLKVVGLWSIPNLPNFSDGTYYDPDVTLGKEHVISGQQIALVEQEMCARSAVFLGSGPSTWSLAVFRLRLAQRRSKMILEKHPSANNMDQKARDELIIQTLLKDKHAAGLHCHYNQWWQRATVNETVETYADEYPDGWLDLDACEGRIGRGGHCQVAKCF